MQSSLYELDIESDGHVVTDQNTAGLEGSVKKLKKLRLRDLTEVPFVWFPRLANPQFYDRVMLACYRGGLKCPRIVQEGYNEATILSLVSTGLGVGWVLGTARWRCPETVTIMPGRFARASDARSGVEKR